MDTFKSILIIGLTILISFIIIDIKNNYEWKWDQCVQRELQIYKTEWDEHCRLLGEEANCSLPYPTSSVLSSEHDYRIGLCKEIN